MEKVRYPSLHTHKSRCSWMHNYMCMYIGMYIYSESKTTQNRKLFLKCNISLQFLLKIYVWIYIMYLWTNACLCVHECMCVHVFASLCVTGGFCHCGTVWVIWKSENWLLVKDYVETPQKKICKNYLKLLQKVHTCS